MVATAWGGSDLQLSKEQGGSTVNLDWKGKNTQWLTTTEEWNSKWLSKICISPRWQQEIALFVICIYYNSKKFFEKLLRWGFSLLLGEKKKCMLVLFNGRKKLLSLQSNKLQKYLLAWNSEETIQKIMHLLSSFFRSTKSLNSI